MSYSNICQTSELLKLLSGKFKTESTVSNNQRYTGIGKRIKNRNRGLSKKENKPKHKPRIINQKRVPQELKDFRRTYTPTSPKKRIQRHPLLKFSNGADSDIFTTQDPRSLVLRTNSNYHVLRLITQRKRLFPYVMTPSGINYKEDCVEFTMPKAIMDGHELVKRLHATRMSKLNPSPTFRLEIILTIFNELGKGLDNLFSKGFIHADFKLNNTLWYRRDDGTYMMKLCDVSRTENIGQPLRYISSIADDNHPDILDFAIKGKATTVDPKYDLYTFAAVLFKNITGIRYSQINIKKFQELPSTHQKRNRVYKRYHDTGNHNKALEIIRQSIKVSKGPNIILRTADDERVCIPSVLRSLLLWCINKLDRNHNYTKLEIIKLNNIIQRTLESLGSTLCDPIKVQKTYQTLDRLMKQQLKRIR